MWDILGSEWDSEIILRTLRANLIPCPRVIVPGPATTFPICHRRPDGHRSLVSSLEECRALLQAIPASAMNPDQNRYQGFFHQCLPVQDTVVFEARRLRGPDAGNYICNPALTNDQRSHWLHSDLSSRASYCLGMDKARVLIGQGPGGPWVLDVAPLFEHDSDQSPSRTLPHEFLGAVGEYVSPDSLAEGSLVSLRKLFVPPQWAGSGSLMDAGGLSSPMPYPDMPQSTRFRFSGVPDQAFLRLLDGSLGLLGMLVSPPGEVRERHLTEEGVLGSVFRQTTGNEAAFEYLPVPSLLWDPVSLKGLMVVAGLVASNLPNLVGKLGPGRFAPLDLKRNYQWQKAYYGAFRRFFQDDLSHLKEVLLPLATVPWDRESLERLFDRASAQEFRALAPPDSGPPLTLQRTLPLGRGLPSESLVSGAGPVVGIMAQEYGQSEKMSHFGRFGVETDRFRLLSQMGRSMGLTVYVFFPDHLGKGASTPGGRLDAWVYAYQKGWVRTSVPVPDVVYDRYIPEIMEDGSTRDVAEAFCRAYPAVKFLNSISFAHCCRDKLASYRALSQDGECASHLPKTEALESVAQAVRFVAEHRVTFIKDRCGTGSKGLVRIERDFCQPEPAIASLVRENPGREYILQEGIPIAPLPETLGGAFEIRVIYQKGGLGKWRRTGMVCRVNPGGEGFMVPRQEVHRRVDDVLAPVFPGRVAQVKNKIRALARRIPVLLEGSSGTGGEMSIDIGLDQDGEPWLIEVNSKPASLFRDIGAFAYRELSLQRALNYCVYLSRIDHGFGATC